MATDTMKNDFLVMLSSTGPFYLCYLLIVVLRNTQVSLINTNKGSALLKYRVPEAEAATWNSAIIKDPLQACSEAFRKILQ